MNQMMMMVLPLIISGILHMIAVKINLLPRLNRPIHEKALGKNKTWRGMLLIPVLTLLAMLIVAGIDSLHSTPQFPWATHGVLWWGISLGLGYALAELPNSWIKRRLKIESGKLPTGTSRWVFLLFDQADSAIGCALVYRWGAQVNWAYLSYLVLIGTAFHLLFNVLLFYLGLRKNKF